MDYLSIIIYYLLIMEGRRDFGIRNATIDGETYCNKSRNAE